MKQNKTYICPVCLNIFTIQNNHKHPYVWFYGKKDKKKYFDKYSCLLEFKRNRKRIKGAGLV